MRGAPARDPYEVLSVDRQATAAEIRAAYRRLALQHHPDHEMGHQSSFHLRRTPVFPQTFFHMRLGKYSAPTTASATRIPRYPASVAPSNMHELAEIAKNHSRE
ncbi:MAG TPA: J domain-containing protein [Polyangia bacterium]